VRVLSTMCFRGDDGLFAVLLLIDGGWGLRTSFATLICGEDANEDDPKGMRNEGN
jgi:hypothetical protein